MMYILIKAPAETVAAKPALVAAACVAPQGFSESCAGDDQKHTYNLSTPGSALSQLLASETS
jgi:hypothetical protein